MASVQLPVPALKRGIKVLTEKPMTTDIEKCKAILRTVQETNNHLTVTFVSITTLLVDMEGF